LTVHAKPAIITDMDYAEHEKREWYEQRKTEIYSQIQEVRALYLAGETPNWDELFPCWNRNEWTFALNLYGVGEFTSIISWVRYDMTFSITLPIDMNVDEVYDTGFREVDICAVLRQLSHMLAEWTTSEMNLHPTCVMLIYEHASYGYRLPSIYNRITGNNDSADWWKK